MSCLYYKIFITGVNKIIRNTDNQSAASKYEPQFELVATVKK
jgi:hypothetical protein